MTQQQSQFDHTTLQWVKRELDETLSQSAEALQQFSEDADDRTQLQFCVTHLHQVRGILQMLELQGAVMLTEEMEGVGNALLEAEVASHDQACEALMRGILRLRDYLERVGAGEQDSALVILPLINDLRTSRGHPIITPSALFAPDLEAAPADTRYERDGSDDVAATAGRLRSEYQRSLLGVLRGRSEQRSAERMIMVLDSVDRASPDDAAGRPWWIASGLVDGLRSDQLTNYGPTVRYLLGQVERCLSATASQGTDGAPGDDLLRAMLYYIARAEAVTDRLDALHRTFGLGELLAEEQRLEQAREGFFGPGAEAFGGVAEAIREDLASVKDTLDMYMRGNEEYAQSLPEAAESMRRIADTLGVLGLAEPRRIVGEQADIIGELSGPGWESSVAIEKAAEALLYVESSLADLVERGRISAGEGDGGEPGEALFNREYRDVLGSTVGQAITEVGRIKEGLVQFLENGDPDYLDGLKGSFESVRGALSVTELTRAASLIAGAENYVNEVLRPGTVPDANALDDLADAVTSIEYYLEAVRDGRTGSEQILDVAAESLQRLGYGDGEPAPAPVAPDSGEPEAAEGPAAPSAETSETASEPETAAESPQTAADEASHDASHADDAAATASHQAPATDDAGVDFAKKRGRVNLDVAVFSDEFDEEILEIFVDEAEEVLETLNDCFPRWRDDPENREALVTTRRMFHTLKGSGRMAGGLLLGELAWAIENLLNRVLDQTLEPDPAIPGMVEEAMGHIPQLVEQLRGGSAPEAEVRDLMRRAAAWSDPSQAETAAAEPTAAADEAQPGKAEGPEPEATSADEPVIGADEEAPGHESTASAASGSGIVDDAPVEADEPVAETEAEASASESDVGDVSTPAMDATLYEIFSKETLDHLAVVEEFLASCDPEACTTSPELLRSLHTLTGSARMAGVESISRLGRALEELARARDNHGAALDPEDQDCMVRGALIIRELVDALGRAGTPLPDVDGLVTEAEARQEHDVGPTLEAMSAPETVEQPSFDWPAALAEPLPEMVFVPAPSTDDAPRASATATPVEPETETELAPYAPEPAPYPVAMSDSAAAAQPDWPQQFEQDAPAPSSEPDVATSPASVETEPIDDEGEEDLTAIFLEEAKDILDSFDDLMTRWETSTDPDVEVAELQRSLHTLKGGARLAQLQSVGDFCHALESLAGDIAEHRLSADDAFFEVLRDCVEELVRVVEVARRGEAPAVKPELLERIEGLRGTTQSGEALGAVETEAPPDQELLEVFLEEAGDILDQSENLLQAWRETPQSTESVTELERALHTLKGGARMAGLGSVADLSHSLETLLKQVGAGQLQPGEAMFDLLDSANDRLVQLREAAEAGKPLTYPRDLLDAIEQIQRGETPEGIGVQGTAGSEASTPAPAASKEAETATSEPAEAESQPAASAQAPEQGRQQSDTVRVRADLLDNLVNYAGEVSIYRARLEQQTGAINFNLDEFEQTVQRLRDQLRSLEIETESQIQTRTGNRPVTAGEESQDGDDEGFDPLEMDRFSRVQELSRALSESVNDLASIEQTINNLNRESETLLLQQSRVNTDLQDGLMRTRMVPFANLVPRLRRIVRQASQDMGKRASLQVLGAEGEMDRTVLERVVPPLEHMLRNSVAHGIEDAATREARGKANDGTISVSLDREGADVVIRVSDDGGGMDLEAIRRKAIDSGFMRPDAELTDREVMQFVLESGFSTAREVTQVAGRGVGMDVVNAEIKQLGGNLEIDSTPEVGTQLTVRLPFTLALNQAILCKSGDETYAIPLSSIEGVTRLDHPTLRDYLARPGEPVYEYAGAYYEVRSLSAILGGDDPELPDDNRQTPLILVQAGEHRIALQVDGLLGSRDIVVKSVGSQISTVQGIFGATILADGRVVLILDVSAMVRLGLGAREKRVEAVEGSATIEAEPTTPAEEAGPKTVMVVDDSITMRKVASRLLERNNLDVLTAKDGVDAVSQLQEHVPDAMLLDIEMPRMDGYELATHMRNDERLQSVPIVMITSRTGEKHRERAMDIGVDRYLGKPYQETDLLGTLNELLENGRDTG